MHDTWTGELIDLQMAWSTSPLSLLNTYRVSHHLSTPAAFTSPLNQALLVNPGIGRQSPTMARRKDKRRVSKDQLATNVRKHFNGAAVNEIDVVVELVYKSRNKGMPLAGYQLLRSTALTPYRQGVPHALSTWHHQKAMTNHFYLPSGTKQHDTTLLDLQLLTLHHNIPRITPHIQHPTHLSAHDIDDDSAFAAYQHSIAIAHTDDIRGR